MARLTLAELEDDIQLWMPNFESARVKAAANLWLRELGRRGFGTFLAYRSTFTTTASVDITGALSVTQGETTVTYASAAAAMVGQVIQIAGSDTWFSITAATVGTDLTISSGFDGATLVSGDGTLAYWRCALPSDLVEVRSVHRAGHGELDRATDEAYDTATSNPSPSAPTLYVPLEPLNTDDDLEIGLLHYPDAIYSFIVTGTRRLERYDGTSSKCGLPEYLEDVLIKGTLAYAWDMEDGPTRSAYWRKMAEQALKDALAHDGPARIGKLQQVTGAGDRLVVSRPNTATEA